MQETGIMTPPVNPDMAPLPQEEEIVVVHDSVPLSNPFQAFGERTDAIFSGMEVDNASLRRRTSESSACSDRSRRGQTHEIAITKRPKNGHDSSFYQHEIFLDSTDDGTQLSPPASPSTPDSVPKNASHERGDDAAIIHQATIEKAVHPAPEGGFKKFPHRTDRKLGDRKSVV